MSIGLTQRREFALAIMGICLNLFGIAFAVRHVEASPPLFWSLIALAVVLLAICAVAPLRRLRRAKKPRAPLVAPECHRVAEAIGTLINEQWRARPRARRFSGNGVELDRWNHETIARYVEELRPWASRVFEDAVRCGVLAESSGPLVDHPQAAQLTKLRDLFRDAGDSLARRQ